MAGDENNFMTSSHVKELRKSVSEPTPLLIHKSIFHIQTCTTFCCVVPFAVSNSHARGIQGHIMWFVGLKNAICNGSSVLSIL